MFIFIVYIVLALAEKLQMIFYLILHNVLYYLIYFTLPFMIYKTATIKCQFTGKQMIISAGLQCSKIGY